MNYQKTSIPLIEARRLPEERILRLTWQDGLVMSFPYTLLQGYCPCAHCRGHVASEIVYLPPKKEISSIELAPVGNYALSIACVGGCNSGIYSFDFLREIGRREGLDQGSLPS
jgi:DUF971 family protein